MNVVRIAVAVVLLVLALVRNTDFMKDWFSLALHRIQVFLLQMIGKVLQGFCAGSQIDLISICQRAYIGQMQGLIKKTAESRLCEPMVECAWMRLIRVSFHPCLQQFLSDDQFTVIQFS